MSSSATAAGAGHPTGAGNAAEPPNEFLCPICLDLLTDPVCIETGHSYDRSCLLSWFSSGACTCPKTGRRLVSSAMLPNMALRNLIADWCSQNNVLLPKSKGAPTSPFGRAAQSPWAAGTTPNATTAWWDYMSALSHWQACMAAAAPQPYALPPTGPAAQRDSTLPLPPPATAPATTIGFPSMLMPPPTDLLPPAPVHPCRTPAAHPLDLPKVPITGDKAEMSRAVLRVLSALNADINMAICIIQNLRARSLDELQPALDMLRGACHHNDEHAARAAARQLSHVMPSPANSLM